MTVKVIFDLFIGPKQPSLDLEIPTLQGFSQTLHLLRLQNIQICTLFVVCSWNWLRLRDRERTDWFWMNAALLLRGGERMRETAPPAVWSDNLRKAKEASSQAQH